MLKNFWYACEFSSAITNKPKRIPLLNQQFVMYRNSKQEVLAFLDQCPHRGAALSLGWVENDCIRCPYHGWNFQSDGLCIQIPANQPGVSIPTKARLYSYPVQEKYGFVWLFWGNLPENQRPPLPSFPEVNNPALRSIQMEINCNAHYTRLLENFSDPAHSALVHANSFGSGMKEEPQLAEYKVHQEAWGATASFNTKQHAPKGFFGKYLSRQNSPEINSIKAFYMPNINYFDVDRGKLLMFVVHVPIDDCTTISKLIQFRSFLTHPWLDIVFRNQILKIYQEDKRIFESQSAKVPPNDLTEEISTPSDALLLAYRQLRQKCLDMGGDNVSYISQSHHTNN